MYDLVTIGDIKLDTFITLPEEDGLRVVGNALCIPFGRKTPVQGITSQIAGTAPNVAIGLAKARTKTAVVSGMGHDSTYALAKVFLAKHQVDTRYITHKPGQPSSFAAVLNLHGESTQLVAHHGGSYRLPAGLKTAWIHVAEQGHDYDRLYQQIITYARRTGCGLSLNPGSVQIAERKPSLFALLKVATILFVNVHEAGVLTGRPAEKDIRKLLAKLFVLGPKVVVITNGVHGAHSFDGHEHHYTPIIRVRCVEATGAGDAFTSGFLMAHLRGATLPEALRWGTINAASVIGFVGPTQGLLSPKEIRRKLGAV